MPRILLLIVLAACTPKVIPYPAADAALPPPGAPGPDPAPEAVAAVEAERVRGRERRAERRARRRQDDVAQEIVDAAIHFIGKATLRCGGETYRYDCSGFVNAAYARAGLDLGLRNTAALYELAQQSGVHHRRKTPRPGDVVFFDNTYDRDRDGRNNDPLSHVAIVERVDTDGTATLIHNGSSKGVSRIVMNLHHPDERSSPDGKPWNSLLRAQTKKDPRNTRYLTGELWAGNASFWMVADALAFAD